MWETRTVDFIWALYFLTAIQRGQDILYQYTLGNWEELIQARALWFSNPSFSISATGVYVILKIKSVVVQD